MHKLIRVLSSRLFLVIALVIAQIYFLLAYICQFSYVNNLTPLFTLIGLLLAVWQVNRKTDPAYKIAWVVVLLAVPVIGVPMYLLCGNKKLSRKLYDGTLNASTKLKATLKEDQDPAVLKQMENTPVSRLFHYGWQTCGFPIYDSTKTTYYKSGEEWFPDYLEALRSAKHFIFIEMFIIDRGSVWDEILSILKEKAAAGVEVKLIYDDFGCVTMPSNMYKKLGKYGVEAYPFNRLRPTLIVQMNNRDHRKLTIIDNRVAFTGGVNLSDEYVNRIVRFGYWRDSAIRVEGPAVWSMTSQFLGMYHYLSHGGEDADYSSYHLEAPHFQVPGFVQPYADSPTDGEYVGMTEHLNLINHARRYVYLNTPYLLLNDAISRALQTAAKNGVDVRILTPHKPDKWLVFQATRSNYLELLQSGVKIYEFTPGFNHSKAIVADDEMAIVGSVNTDFRSYFLHFEDGVLMWHTDAVKDVRKDFMEAIGQSQEITSTYVLARTNVFIRIFRGILHMLMPLA